MMKLTDIKLVILPSAHGGRSLILRDKDEFLFKVCNAYTKEEIDGRTAYQELLKVAKFAGVEKRNLSNGSMYCGDLKKIEAYLSKCSKEEASAIQEIIDKKGNDGYVHISGKNMSANLPLLLAFNEEGLL